VRETGPGRWIAKCPAHKDRNPSLSIRELDDGRILLNDFAGCPTTDVIAALGMQMIDLFPEPLGHQIRPSHARIPAADILNLIAVAIVLGMFSRAATGFETMVVSGIVLLYTILVNYLKTMLRVMGIAEHLAATRLAMSRGS
jgi:hypothetical protein